MEDSITSCITADSSASVPKCKKPKPMDPNDSFDCNRLCKKHGFELNCEESSLASDAKLAFQPKIDFERFMVKQMKLQSARLNKLKRSIAKIHKKLIDGLDDEDVFGSDIEDDIEDASDAKLAFKPKTDFERFMVKQMMLQSAILNKLERSIAKIHKKLDDGLDNEDGFGSDIEDDIEDASDAKLAFQPKTDFERVMVKQMKLTSARLNKLERSMCLLLKSIRN